MTGPPRAEIWLLMPAGEFDSSSSRVPERFDRETEACMSSRAAEAIATHDGIRKDEEDLRNSNVNRYKSFEIKVSKMTHTSRWHSKEIPEALGR